MGIITFFKSLFNNKEPTYTTISDDYNQPIKTSLDVLNSIYNRLAIDVSSIDIKHCKLDKDDRYVEDVDSNLNRCLKISANVDQTGRTFMKDLVLTMLVYGVAVIVPTEYTYIEDKETKENLKDINSMRVGYIEDWYTTEIKVSVYNEHTGKRSSIKIEKKDVAIIENPFHMTMNQNNSVLRRLKEKTRLIDDVDYNNYSRLDLLFKMPYSSKSDISSEKAKKRFKEIKEQLSESNLGAAYLELNEDIVQLNRPISNSLVEQISSLTRMLYSQLGITEEILNGTANEKTMTNYYSRIIEPILMNIAEEIKRKFLSDYALKNKETILYFRDPFKLVPVSEIAEIADKFTRNEILSSNEIRQKIGTKPSSDKKADQLINSNLNQSKESIYDEY